MKSILINQGSKLGLNFLYLSLPVNVGEGRTGVQLYSLLVLGERKKLIEKMASERNVEMEGTLHAPVNK